MVAEFIGTFALVFFGVGSIVVAGPMIGAGSLVTVALAHGIALTVFITGTMYISGGQLNPAVSVGLAIIGKQAPSRAIAFIIAQCAAGIAAAGLILLFFGSELAEAPGVNLGATLGRFSSGETQNMVGLIGLEAIATFALMFAVLATIVDDRAPRLGGMGVGLVVAMDIMAIGPVTGASMNPARSLGPAAFGHWDAHWAYWVAPIGGAVLAALVYRFAFEKPSKEA
jgi:MIP family channel proteins